jgi:hypothetical protein
MNELKLYLSYWHKDAKGKTIKYRRYRSDSFVGNFYKHIYNQLFKSTLYQNASVTQRSVNAYTDNSIKNVNGESANLYHALLNSQSASAGDDTLGIVVGSGSTAVTLNDYNLVSKIPHGTTAGRLSYGAMPSTNITPINTTLSNSWYYSITRSFSNQSTSNVGIYEVGFIAYIFNGFAGNFVSEKFLITRDVLQTPIILAPNESTIIKYTFSLTI